MFVRGWAHNLKSTSYDQLSASEELEDWQRYCMGLTHVDLIDEIKSKMCH